MIIKYNNSVELAKLIARGTQYSVFEDRESGVIKIPFVEKSTFAYEQDFLLRNILQIKSDIYEYLLTSEIIVNPILNGFNPKTKINHAIIQDKIDFTLRHHLQQSTVSISDIFKDLIDLETYFWCRGYFIQDTISYLDNFTTIDGKIILFDFSSITKNPYLAETWLNSKWSMERQKAIYDTLIGFGKLEDGIHLDLIQHYDPKKWKYFWNRGTIR